MKMQQKTHHGTMPVHPSAIARDQARPIGQRLRILALLAGAILFATAWIAGVQNAGAQSKSRIPDMSLYKAMLDGNRESGWIAFANHGERQFIYFSALQTLHCRLSEIRYSINTRDLDKRFDLVDCNPQNPFALPPDSGPEDTVVILPGGTARSVAVQVVWEDGTESDIQVYEPCEDVGDQACSWPID